MKERILFTSESVSEGHPDKVCDQISDAILDECFKQDPNSRVACECFATTNLVVIGGEITTNAKVDYEAVARNVLKEIGYDDEAKGMDYKTCKIEVVMDSQSSDIALGTNEEVGGAGDQGIMFGYASNETAELMPLSHLLATQLGKRLTDVRKDGTLKWVRPDGKTQVTIEYKEEHGHMIPIRVHTVVISTQHDDNVTNEQIHKDLMEYVIKPIIPAKLLDEKTIFHLNPSGRFVIGGPSGDAGLTGRKIIVDTYGGWGAHGGGAFSGKDSSKVDRSAAYAARWIAKSLVNAGICSRCLIQLSYAIGVNHPLSIHVDTYGTSEKTESEIVEIIKNNFDLRPGCIIRDLGLNQPIFKATAAYGHFGRKEFPWETCKDLKL